MERAEKRCNRNWAEAASEQIVYRVFFLARRKKQESSKLKRRSSERLFYLSLTVELKLSYLFAIMGYISYKKT